MLMSRGAAFSFELSTQSLIPWEEDIMKRKIFIILIIPISLLIFIASAYAIDIDGWWRVRGKIQQGDFVTGEWITFNSRAKQVSYMYISGAQENSYNTYGGTWLYLWSPRDSKYIEEIYPIIYIKNNIILFFGPTGQDDAGNFWGYTIVLKPLGPIGRPSSMTGFYTLYDMENVGTPDQFIRMGTIDMIRVEPKDVPEEVKNNQITD